MPQKRGLGHTLNGTASVAVINLIPNPSFETTYSGWNSEYGINGSGTTTNPVSGGLTGSRFMRMAWTVAQTSMIGVGYYGDATSIGRFWVDAKAPYTGSLYVRSSISQKFHVGLYVFPSLSSWSVSFSDSSADVTTPANTWVRLSVTTTPNVSGYAGLWLVGGSGYSLYSSGDTLDVDGVMATKGNTLYSYADGASIGWWWLGDANRAALVGPAL